MHAWHAPGAPGASWAAIASGADLGAGGARENANTRACDCGSGHARSSVNARMAIALPCHLHDPPTKNHSAWESISLEDPARVAAPRVDVAASPTLAPIKPSAARHQALVCTIVLDRIRALRAVVTQPREYSPHSRWPPRSLAGSPATADPRPEAGASRSRRPARARRGYAARRARLRRRPWRGRRRFRSDPLRHRAAPRSSRSPSSIYRRRIPRNTTAESPVAMLCRIAHLAATDDR